MCLFKIAFVLSPAINGSFSSAQLPTVYAKGGDGKNIDWESTKKAAGENSEESNLPYFDNDCLMELTVIQAVSVFM